MQWMLLIKCLKFRDMANFPDLNFTRSLLNEGNFEKIFLTFLRKYAINYDFVPDLGEYFFQVGDQEIATKLGPFDLVKNDTEFSFKENVKKEFLNKLFEEREKLIGQIQNEILTNEKGVNRYLSLLYEEHNQIIVELISKNWLLDFPYIAEEIKERLKYLTYKFPISKSNIQASNMESRIIWNASLSSLVTLFKDLQTNYLTSKNTPYIRAGNDEIIRFILINFVNSDNLRFKEESIRRNLTKPAKRDNLKMEDLIPNSIRKKPR